MTITVERPGRPAPEARAATIALARAEARRMWRSPFLWIGVLLSIALGAVWSWNRMPSWETFHENVGMASLVLAAFLLVAAHLAAGRDHRSGAEESTRTMPAGPGRRSLALLATVLVAAAAGAVVHLAVLLLLLPTWPVGRFEPWVTLTSAVVPAIGAATGVAVGRVLPKGAAGPLTVAAFTVLLFLLLVMPSDPAAPAVHLLPIIFVTWDFGVPQPFGWHLLYLLGLLVAAVAAACRQAAPKATAVIAVAALVCAGLAVRQETAETPDAIDVESARRHTAPAMLDCRSHEGVRYCALPGYAPWIGYWREAVEPMAKLLPASALKPSVRQISTIDDLTPMTPGHPEVVTEDHWGRFGSWAERSRKTLAGHYAATAVGILRREDPDNWRTCDGRGQHRTVVALWLLGTAAPGRGWTLSRTTYGPAEIRAAESLLARPPAEVSAHLVAHWTEVLDPRATALAGLGVTITPPAIPTAEPAPVPDGEMVPADRGVCR
ncbi:ABC transporter permease [Actinoplanes utahensis]|uniref:Uncharacterized protein n=1 Tax=Actinoplanes utahensis TaxID=1869 RepID=A0A0A6ULP4_ACTUT|nr:ABC transporter permease [Actinoplanes utahensis]KHD76326.1 hypothetical protein MB27_18155 [Actinoplanes utahensis]GIF30971.1 hypothetical protein Aut01nite_39570 [Actinoplanes utahensis]